MIEATKAFEAINRAANNGVVDPAFQIGIWKEMITGQAYDKQ